MQPLATVDVSQLMRVFLATALTLSSVTFIGVTFVLRESLLVKAIRNEWVGYRSVARTMLVSLGLGLLTAISTMTYIWVEGFLSLLWRQVYAMAASVLLLSVIVIMFVAVVRLAKRVLRNP